MSKITEEELERQRAIHGIYGFAFGVCFSRVAIHSLQEHIAVEFLTPTPEKDNN